MGSDGIGERSDGSDHDDEPDNAWDSFMNSVARQVRADAYRFKWENALTRAWYRLFPENRRR